jgi:hypothetical protein
LPPRRPSSPQPQAPALSPAQIRRRIERLQQCITDLNDFRPEQVQKRFNITEVVTLEAGIKDALEHIPLTFTRTPHA